MIFGVVECGAFWACGSGAIQAITASAAIAIVRIVMRRFRHIGVLCTKVIYTNLAEES
jgi:hypothetical protein